MSPAALAGVDIVECEEVRDGCKEVSVAQPGNIKFPHILGRMTWVTMAHHGIVDAKMPVGVGA